MEDHIFEIAKQVTLPLSTSAESPSAAAFIEQPGDSIGPYLLEDVLGEGGFGVVFRAQQEKPISRQVALKVIKAGMDTRQVVARFEAERQALALMDHAHIAKVHDAGSTKNGRPYFVMELVDGAPVTRFCDEQRYGLRRRLELFGDICAAVQHAHQKGIIHRDLKPSNILVTLEEGTPVPKIIDFGIAKATGQELGDHSVFTREGQLLGTPVYMSPEQAGLAGADVDTRSDIYSLGVVLYELLTGKLPFDPADLKSAGMDEIRRMIREKATPKPSTRLTSMEAGDQEAISRARATEPRHLASLLRGDLDWILLKAMEKDRDRRYETANAFRQDVNRFLANEPVSASPPSTTYRFRKFVRRNRLGVTVGAGMVALLLGGISATTWQAAKAREASAAQAKAAHEAREEAEKSRRFGDFLSDLLMGVGPSVARGQDTGLLREILDETMETLEGDLKGYPEVKAELLLVLGTVYRQLGEYEQAEAVLKSSLQMARGVLWDSNPDFARANAGDCLNQIGIVLRRVGNLDEAEQTHSEALRLRKEVYGEVHDKVADSLNNLGLVLWDSGKLAEASRRLREALPIMRETRGNIHESVASVLNNLALVHHQSWELAEAEQIMRESLAVARGSIGEADPIISGSLGSLALILRDMNRLTEAATTAEEGLEMARLIFEPGHSDIAHPLGVLGSIHLLLGRFEDAEDKFREAVLIRRSAFGKNSPKVAEVLNLLAMACLKQKELMESESFLRESLEICREAYGDEHSSLASPLDKLGAVLLAKEDLTGAEAAFERALQLRTTSVGKNHRYTLKARQGLAEVQMALDRAREAEVNLRSVLDSRTESNTESWERFETMTLLGSSLVAQEKYPSAERLLLDGWQGLNARRDSIPPVYAVACEDALQRLAALYDAWNKPEEAKKWRENTPER